MRIVPRHVVDTDAIIPIDIKPNPMLNPPSPPIHSEQDKHQEDRCVVHQGSKEEYSKTNSNILGMKIASKSSSVQGTYNNSDNEFNTSS